MRLAGGADGERHGARRRGGSGAAGERLVVRPAPPRCEPIAVLSERALARDLLPTRSPALSSESIADLRACEVCYLFDVGDDVHGDQRAERRGPTEWRAPPQSTDDLRDAIHSGQSWKSAAAQSGSHEESDGLWARLAECEWGCRAVSHSAVGRSGDARSDRPAGDSLVRRLRVSLECTRRRRGRASRLEP